MITCSPPLRERPGDRGLRYAVLFQLVRHPQREILAPRRRYDLYPDWQLTRLLDRHCHDRQADERQRLGERPEIGTDGKLSAVEHKNFLAEFWRRARRCRRQDHIHLVE